jgi:hypothetical protein
VIALLEPSTNFETCSHDLANIIDAARRDGTTAYAHYNATFVGDEEQLVLLSALAWMAKKAEGRVVFVRQWPMPMRGPDFITGNGTGERVSAFIRFSVTIYVPQQGQEEAHHGQEAQAV